jgi:hypothetical protein
MTTLVQILTQKNGILSISYDASWWFLLMWTHPKRGKRSEQGGKLKDLMLLNEQLRGWLKQLYKLMSKRLGL